MTLDTDFRKQIGRILAQNRQAKGLELHEAAKRLRVCPFWLRRVEEGNEQISQDQAEAIAYDYGINMVLVPLAYERKFLRGIKLPPPPRP